MIEQRDLKPYREQLASLPDVFSLAEMRRILEYPTHSAHITLKRWMDKGFIEPLAPRSGVYFNLEKNKKARNEHLALAISRKYPVVRIIGPHVLANHGWTTQIQHYYSLAVNIPPIHGSTSLGDGYLRVPEVKFTYRTKKWWRAALWDAKGLAMRDSRVVGFETVSPAFALVDMWMHRDHAWFPGEDDLYLEDDEAGSLILDACRKLDVDPAPLFDSIGLPLSLTPIEDTFAGDVLQP
jgi:hypothetical protein